MYFHIISFYVKDGMNILLTFLHRKLLKKCFYLSSEMTLLTMDSINLVHILIRNYLITYTHSCLNNHRPSAPEELFRII